MKQCSKCGLQWTEPPEKCPQCRYLLIEEAVQHDSTTLTIPPSSEEDPTEHRCKLCGISLADEDIYCFSCGGYDTSQSTSFPHVATSLLTPQQRRDKLVEQFQRWAFWIIIISVMLAIIIFYTERSVAVYQANQAFLHGLAADDSLPGNIAIVMFLHAVATVIGGFFLALLVRGAGELLRTLGGIEDKLP
jgi:hypothetical protein